MLQAIVKTIDDIDVIIGFSKLHIDPVATEQKWLDHLQSQAVFKDVQKLNKDIQQTIIKSHEALQMRNNKKYQALQKEFEKLTLKIQNLSQQIEDMKKDFYKNNAEYFEPSGKGFIVKKDDPIIEKLKSLKRNQVLKIDGTVINDNRGKEYHIKENDKWRKEKVEKLGNDIPENGFEKLNSNQLQEIEYQEYLEMSKEDKEKYVDELYKVAMMSAQNLRYELEIKGDMNALEKSQILYNDEIEKIKEVYEK